LFDPNFDKYLDVDMAKEVFLIKCPSGDKEKTIEISNSLLSLKADVDFQQSVSAEQ
jgi:hypothetical protein